MGGSRGAGLDAGLLGSGVGICLAASFPTTLAPPPGSTEVVDVFTVFKNTLWGGDRGEKSANTF